MFLARLRMKGKPSSVGYSPFFARQKKGFSFFSCGATPSRTVAKTQPLKVDFSLQERVDLRSQKEGILGKKIAQRRVGRTREKRKKGCTKKGGVICAAKSCHALGLATWLTDAHFAQASGSFACCQARSAMPFMPCGSYQNKHKLSRADHCLLFSHPSRDVRATMPAKFLMGCPHGYLTQKTSKCPRGSLIYWGWDPQFFLGIDSHLSEKSSCP